MKSTKEKEWLDKFYRGTLLVKGWNQRTSEILKAVPNEEQETVRAKLDSLGEKIGPEWSKDNDVRRIDTVMLQNWGDALQKAKQAGVNQLLARLESIEAEVDSIL